jgi:hypothetical protein
MESFHRRPQPGHHHPAVLHGLAEPFDGIAPELGDLVEEQDAVVSECSRMCLKGCVRRVSDLEAPDSIRQASVVALTPDDPIATFPAHVPGIDIVSRFHQV